MKDKKNKIRAIDALVEAERIAFSPFLFQAVITMRELGVFDLIFEERSNGGINLKDLAEELSLSEYGVGILLEITESSDLVTQDENGMFHLTKIGYFLNFDPTTGVNINFSNDVCYKGLFHLTDTIKKGKPEGLKELGNWKTIYEGLTRLDPKVKNSWFDFDHHYSDRAFGEALDIVFGKKPSKIFDIGGNTGKFALSCCKHDPEVKVTIFDLPKQLEIALNQAKKNGCENRIDGRGVDWLKSHEELPLGADVIWMSQFLDCFSKKEIIEILRTCSKAMDEDTELMIMETFTDRQKFKSAKYILQATSLYFATMANGNSKMYSAEEMKQIVQTAGMKVVEDINLPSEYHTILVCKKESRN